MSTSTWGGPEPYDGETYPPALLKHLLKQMMAQFAAHGACIALPDESIDQMRIRMHVRVRDIYAMQPPGSLGSGNLRAPRRPLTIHLEHDKPSSLPVRPRSITSALPASPSLEELDEVPPQQCELFAVGSAYPIEKDLIGYAWRKREAYVMSHDEYLTVLHDGLPACQMDIIPTSYLVVPIMEPTLVDEMRGRRRQPRVVAVVVLYQVASGAGFQQKQRAEAMQYVERIALYLQNDSLQRAQQRTSEYLQRLQAISTAFPTSVKLSDLVESIYNFTAQVVDASSVLLTLYDRDTERIYDVFAIRNGTRVDIFTEQPSVMLKEERPTWWQVTQTEKQMLHFSPAQDPQKASAYRELLSGAWGDQRHAESFLLLPMKMFNRVIGSLAIASMYPNAYHREEIQVLETMTQIVTVSIENAKLYERDRQLLREAKQREGQLAAINSALQSIGSELNVSTLLNNFVQSVATMVKVDVCVFFQFSASRGDLFANAIYGSSIITLVDDGSGVPPVTRPPRQAEHDKLINMIRLPFKGSFLEQMAREGFFYLDTSQMEDLAKQCEEGGAIFLRETHMQQMFMIPMSSQTEMIGILAVPIFTENRYFRPKEIGTLLAICAQATSAIRNAQLFEQREEAYAELERMNKLKDEFLVTASHELRTPLSAISGYSSLLKRQSGRISSQQVLRFANKIAGAAQQLTDQVANMTEAANLGAVDKKLELKIGPVQLLSAAEVAVNMLTLSIEQKIAFHVDPILWVNGDGLHVRQVMTNLLENAAKYSPPDTQIQLSANAFTLAQVAEWLSEDQIDHAMLVEQKDLPVVLVRVQDQGEGILPDDQQRIFDKFVRAPRSLTTPVRGSGLGLYICRRYIEAMGGKLWLEQSIPNEGSIFSFYLPRVEPPIEAGEQDAGKYKTA